MTRKKPKLANISFLDKLKEITFYPNKLFSNLKKEHFKSSYKLYSKVMFFFSILIFLFISKRLWSGILASGENLVSNFLLFIMIIVFLGIYLALALVIPSLIVAVYLFFLKTVFKIKVEYENCYKVIIYSILQLCILSFIAGVIIFILHQINQLLAIFVGVVLVILLSVYNIITEITGLYMLCKIKKKKASEMILLQLFVFFIVILAGIFAFKYLYAIFLQNF